MRDALAHCKIEIPMTRGRHTVAFSIYFSDPVRSLVPPSRISYLDVVDIHYTIRTVYILYMVAAPKKVFSDGWGVGSIVCHRNWRRHEPSKRGRNHFLFHHSNGWPANNAGSTKPFNIIKIMVLAFSMNSKWDVN